MKQLKLLLNSPWFVTGAGLFVLCVAFGLLYPLFSHTDPFLRSSVPFEPPSSAHWLGTNAEGQDMLARLLFGLRASLFVGIAAGLCATFIGTVIGIIGGYKGGVVDNVLTLITNLFMVIPSILVLILISQSIEKRSLFLVAVIIGATTWPWTARAVNAQTSSLKNREHVNLARLNGYGFFSILFMQILPYIMSYVFMVFIIQMATGILNEAAISMMGLGPYDTVTLGQIINQAQKTEAFTVGNWWAFIPATLIITALQYSLYIVNTSMEGIFNPRLRKEEKK